MNWAWATSLDQVWRSPAFPMWLSLAAAGFFGIIVLITLLRAEKSVANGALTVIALLAIAVAVSATLRGFSPGAGVAGTGVVAETPSLAPVSATLPALSCIDEMAGEAVLAACEKALFGSAESTAAAVSYAAARIARLTAFGDVAAANRNMSPELDVLRHSIERDRYGLAAYVLLTRDHCSPADCAAFRSLTDHNQIVANMDERVYENLVTHYAATWNAPPVAMATVGAFAGLGTSMPTGKPTNADFPSAASTPPVSIMNPEPGTAAASRAPAAAASNVPAAANRPAPHPAPAAGAPVPAAVARKPAPKPRVAAPVQIAPPAPAATASAPAASNE